MPRYTVRRLHKLPSTEEGLRRYTVLNPPGMLDRVSVQHEVLRPGAEVPEQVEDERGTLVFTLSGRGVMELDGDRVEVAANDLVHIPPAVPYAMKTLGTSDWTYVVVQGPAAVVQAATRSR